MLSDLQKLVIAIQADLWQRSEVLPDVRATMEVEYERARKQQRTGGGPTAWREDFLAQVASAWVLACVFVRYLEDNDLIAERWLGGTDNRGRDEARHRHQHYFRDHKNDSDREYLQHVFRSIGAIPAASELFAEGKTPLWVVGPSGDMARDILAFWQDPAKGALERTFEATPGDTRFLGDLYQDLSEDVRKKFALLQTPVFVEQFILDRTLTPALAEFGLEAVRLIDPTCGSGHFLLGAFERLFKEWQKRWQQTGDVRDTNRVALAQKALDQIHGVDINPYAVAIARFRLIVAAAHACGLVRLKDAPVWTLHVHTGDSLYYGTRWTPTTNVVNDSMPFPSMEAFFNYHGLEDPGPVNKVLSQKYHAVVGNPPYIAAKDTALSRTYRERYKTCHGKYSLGVPFTERFFDLCLAPEEGKHGAGYIGMITASSFMKNEFGKKLIEDYFPRVDLTHVIDTAGVPLHGHGTNTAILLGRNRRPIEKILRVVRGIRGEDAVPEVPEQGNVWRSIVDLIDLAGSQNQFISVADVPRQTLSSHPWAMGGGGAAELKVALDEASSRKLTQVVEAIGVGIVTLEDEAFQISDSLIRRLALPAANVAPLGLGDCMRDWAKTDDPKVIFPYDKATYQPTCSPRVINYLWPYRGSLWNRTWFHKTQRQRALEWWEYGHIASNKFASPLSIIFTEIASHNHFVLVRERRFCDQTAPMVKLGSQSTEDDHVSLLGLLNSSIAGFWLRQVCRPKGGDHVGTRGARVRKNTWDERYAFASKRLEQFPLPEGRPTVFTRQLDSLGQEFAGILTEVIVTTLPTRADLISARDQAESVRRQMIALQEELDWQCYHLYGLTDEPFTFQSGAPPICLGERAFEIVLARKVAAGEVQTAWFERHRSTPITEVPTHWPADYRALVEKRIATISGGSHPPLAAIALIEQPEYKRRWNSEPWEDQEQRALLGWLLDRLETERYWPRPAQNGEPLLQSCTQLAAIAQTDTDFMQVGALYTSNPVFDLPTLVEELVASESVPYLPVLRYKPSGLLKRAEWEKTWDLQRKEDAGEKVGAIPVPPKYTSADFQKSDFWRLRGKLDVPKERWVSYPHAERDGDASLVVTWAGYDHLEQTRALAAYYDAMKGKGWPADRLAPLLAGIDQLVPWLLQWHNDFDPEMQLRWGEFFRDFVRDEAKDLGKTMEGVRGWHPPEKKRAARKRTKGAKKQPDEVG